MLFFKRIYLFLFIVLFFSSSVFASGIEGSYGFGVATGSYQLKSSDGTLDPETYTSPIHLFYMAEMGSTSRLTAEFFTYSFKFKSVPTKTLGTEVVNSGVNFLYEEELKFSNFFKPVIGIGLSVSKLIQSARHSTTITGNLNQKFANKDEFVASMLFSVGYDLHVTDNMFVYGRAMQTLGISSDLTETQFLIAFMFRK